MSAFNIKALVFEPYDEGADTLVPILIALLVVHVYVQLNILYSYYWPAHRQHNVRLYYMCCFGPSICYLAIFIWYLIL